MIHHERVLGALGIFALLVGLVIFIFMCYQFSLVYNGTTANEAFKWEDLEEIIMAGELWVFEKEPEEGKDKVKGRSTAVYWMQPSSAKQRNKSSESDNGENSKQIGRQVKSMSEVRNLYDQGLFGNFKEALFPPSF